MQSQSDRSPLFLKEVLRVQLLSLISVAYRYQGQRPEYYLKVHLPHMLYFLEFQSLLVHFLERQGLSLKVGSKLPSDSAVVVNVSPFLRFVTSTVLPGGAAPSVPPTLISTFEPLLSATAIILPVGIKPSPSLPPPPPHPQKMNPKRLSITKLLDNFTANSSFIEI